MPYSRVQPQLAETGHQPQPSLPPETVVEGVRRLGWLGLVYSVGICVAAFSKLALSAVSGTLDASDFGIPDVFGLAAVAMGLGVFAVVRRGMLSSTRLLDFGLFFLVFGALGITVREFWSGMPQAHGVSFSVPAECVWLVVYPLLVPNTPKKILFSSLLAASMGPFALVISAAANGTTVGRWLDVAAYFATSTYLCAILAYVVARIVHRVNMRLNDAREIGSYELIEPIGAGGMGEVWRAQHRLLASPAAIKLIRSNWLGDTLSGRDTLVRRFKREARDTAALRSIHTIDVYDFGLTDQGDFYYVMELLDGVSIEQLVKTFGPVCPARAVYLLRQACHSLGEAHARGLVHRDVKPANIFVCQLGPDEDFVKVLDFGLVKHDAQGATVTMLSMEGTTAGTPAYMAPEVALGHPNADGRADIYSLGCVAYYLLTGQPVFPGDNLVATAMSQVQDTPVPPSRRSDQDIPPALEALILECLAKDPAARPASAAVVSARLAATVPVDAWTPDAAHAWWETHRPQLTSAREQSDAHEPGAGSRRTSVLTAVARPRSPLIVSNRG